MAYPLYIEELLAKWSRNEISDSELAVNSGIEDPAELEALKQEHLNAVKAIRYFALRQAVANVHSQYTAPAKAGAPAKVMRLVPRQWIRIGVAAALLVGLFAIQQMVWVSNSSMYNQMFQPYQLTIERNSDIKATGLLINAFRQGRYNEVLQHYRLLQVKSAREHFFAGYASLQLDKTMEATQLFDLILSGTNPGGLYSDEAEYYLGLAQLKAGNKKKAAELFEKILQQPEHSYYDAVSQWDVNRIRWSY
jgi:tetratricopeptide (TPR) repeat protein